MTKRRWRFYRTASGGEPVRAELDALGMHARAAVVEAMARRSRGESFPRELERVDRDISSLRVTFDGGEFRILYAEEAAHGQVLLALVALHKKSRKLPAPAMTTARRRLLDWRQRGRQ